jgi:predicted DNA-binding transcriptional regulator AlpA
VNDYLSADDVCELIPGMTEPKLRNLRFQGKGPRFMKPTEKTVVYKRSEVIEWLESTARVQSDS